MNFKVIHAIENPDERAGRFWKNIDSLQFNFFCLLSLINGNICSSISKEYLIFNLKEDFPLA